MVWGNQNMSRQQRVLPTAFLAPGTGVGGLDKLTQVELTSVHNRELLMTEARFLHLRFAAIQNAEILTRDSVGKTSGIWTDIVCIDFAAVSVRHNWARNICISDKSQNLLWS